VRSKSTRRNALRRSLRKFNVEIAACSLGGGFAGGSRRRESVAERQNVWLLIVPFVSKDYRVGHGKLIHAGQMMMPWKFRILMLVLSLLAPFGPARADKIIVLKQPVLGCANKADLARAGKDFPKDARCIQLSKGPVKIHRIEGTYTCVYRPSNPCLWVPSELIGESIMDDGAF
jgi:hypothetical protein